MTDPTQVAYLKAQDAERRAARKRNQRIIDLAASGMKQEDIAELMGPEMSQGRVSQIISAAKKKEAA